MALKIYELITVTIKDGDREVNTRLFNYKHELEGAFAAKVVKTLKDIKENYGEDGFVDADSSDMIAIEEASVQYSVGWDDCSFWAEDVTDPGLYEVQMWMVEHEI